MTDEVPPATVVKDGKLGGDVPRPPERPMHRRHLSNYLLDKRLQLRYVVVVTLLSAIICGTLGFLIYEQEHEASQFLEEDLKALTAGDASLADFQSEVSRDMESRDNALVTKMALAGIGLVLILSLYVVVMTHKVAGPLYKVSSYFDRMAAGRFPAVSPLRKGDMLQDFFHHFEEMHGAVRARMVGDVELMQRVVSAARAAGVKGALSDEIGKLETYARERRERLG